MMQLDGPSCPGYAHCVPFTCLKRTCIATRTSLPWRFLIFSDQFELGQDYLSFQEVQSWTTLGWTCGPQTHQAFGNSMWLFLTIGWFKACTTEYQPYHASVFPGKTDVF